jgi:hypothetical protein
MLFRKPRRLYNRAKELEPHNPLFYLKLGQVKRASGDGKPEGLNEQHSTQKHETYYQKAIEEKAVISRWRTTISLLFSLG